MTMLAVGFEEALIGYGNQFNNHVAIYDRDKCIDILMERDGMAILIIIASGLEQLL